MEPPQSAAVVLASLGGTVKGTRNGLDRGMEVFYEGLDMGCFRT